MRVVGGTARGMTIEVPSTSDMRPTTDRVRGAMFSMLEARGAVEGVRVLDLYAGSGALGIEALSRGAEHAVLVEENARACAAIARNLATTGMNNHATVVRSTVTKALDVMVDSFDLVFMDPPYSDGLAVADTVERLLARNLVSEGAVLVVEQASRRRRDFARAGALRSEQEKTYGDTAVSLYVVDSRSGDGDR